ncbi:ADP-ribosylglycohydrolase family protein [Endozoicomonas gorgoniicola]|uniref:ADP-ribosylglycohydrolase family protein n=1 Tax=Endozoicomonas gorgoniicola TaxID=1234144 RepID=A0ABT3MZP1_9GAMM|nr:ADP-ribosylglycohydrolase family protein [Endozoicomonas gorgoniicola]MCW7554563.1 ADP-ribosylglycohydrolase family protein [Endozoicomonas gorgoniicola]
MPAFATPPTNAELALLGTALGDHKGEHNYKKKPDQKGNVNSLFTDDTQKAAAIFAFLSEFYTKKCKHINMVEMARFQCFIKFPKNQRFGLMMEGSPEINLTGYGVDHARLLKRFYKGFEQGSIKNYKDILQLSGTCIKGNTGSWGNGGCMGIAPIVGILDSNPYISDQDFVSLVTQVVQVSHNHPQAISSAIAIALAARSSIEYRTTDAMERPARRAFAQATIERIRAHVSDSSFLKCLKVVENYVGTSSHDDISSHGRAMSELNQYLPPNDRRYNPRSRVLQGSWGPSSAAAVLHFFFTETETQLELLQLVEQFTSDQDTVGAMLMALSALREGGFRHDEFNADELQGLLNFFPPWVRMNRNASDYLTDNAPGTATDACTCAGACGCATGYEK